MMGAQPMARAKDQSISAGSGARQGRRSEGRSRDLKHRMILEAAGACFFKLGYEGTSIGSIVERTGGSIASIYAIFGSKRGLFEAFIRDRAQRSEEHTSELQSLMRISYAASCLQQTKPSLPP